MDKEEALARLGNLAEKGETAISKLNLLEWALMGMIEFAYEPDKEELFSFLRVVGEVKTDLGKAIEEKDSSPSKKVVEISS